jgi:hypothetical protein
MVPPTAAIQGWPWITRDHLYAVVSERGLGSRRGTSCCRGLTKNPAMMTTIASGNPTIIRVRIVPPVSQGPPERVEAHSQREVEARADSV